MYSGTTLTAASGRLGGAHQKIDRVARRHLQALLNEMIGLPKNGQRRGLLRGRNRHPIFPTIGTILHFEGRNGPDGIKRKSPAQDEPWHYLSPFDENDTTLKHLIRDHYTNLVRALAENDMVVASFEAAWMSHAIVDGLTPAHHYPYEEKLEELRGGRGKETRVTLKDKVVIPGATGRELLSNNWKMWGSKGLLTTHFYFEWGVATILLPMRVGASTRPTAEDIEAVRIMPAEEYFTRAAREVAAFAIYDDFMKHGWTARMARTVRQQLVPILVRTVTLIWYKAYVDAKDMQAGKLEETS